MFLQTLLRVSHLERQKEDQTNVLLRRVLAWLLVLDFSFLCVAFFSDVILRNVCSQEK